MGDERSNGTTETVLAELRQLNGEAKRGNADALPRIRELLDSYPQLWQHFGDVTGCVEARWLDLAAGDDVPPYYDSLIAKVIAHGETREEALTTLDRALAASRVEGVATTLALHRSVLRSPEFRSGDYDTRSIPGWPSSR